MSEEETYPINRENMADWKEAVSNAERENCDILAERAIQEGDWENMQKRLDQYEVGEGCDKRDNTDTYKLFAEIFENVIRHISFTEMLEKIHNICKEIAQLVVAEEYDDIYMYVSDAASKSNTWVSLLFTHFLSKNRIFQEKAKVISEINLVYDLYNIDPDKKILVLHVDDMSYSGTQMEQSVGDPGSLLKKKKENENLHYYLCVSFIGSSALERFSREGHTNVKIFKNTEIIKKFIEQAKKYVEDTYGQYHIATANVRAIISSICSEIQPHTAQEQGYGTSFPAFQCYDSIIPVYFDHKLADGVSTFQKLLYFGSVPTTDIENCKDIPLIHNCEQAIEKSATWLTEAHCFTNITDIEDEDTCPLTFYKRFNYTYNGVEVPKEEMVVDFIDSQNKSHGRVLRKRGSSKGKKHRKSKKNVVYNKKKVLRSMKKM